MIRINKAECSTSHTQRYRYDSLNRLSEVQDAQGNSIARYGYDPLSRRLWKEQYRMSSGQLLPQASRTYYQYADEGLLAEATQAITLSTTSDANGNPSLSSSASATALLTAQYGVKPDSEFSTGVLFVKAMDTNNQNTIAYYHHDHLSTPLQASDKQGHIVWSASYEAFGQATITTPTPQTDAQTGQAAWGTITSNLRLPGQYADEETGWHYNWHRYYEPATGRYVTEDPIGLRGGLNTFTYVIGSPLYYADSIGLQIPAPPPPIILPPVPGPNNGLGDSTNTTSGTSNTSADKNKQTTYQTYTRYNPNTRKCYTGRTSGTDSPEENVRQRGMGQPHLNAEGFDPPILDRSSNSYWSIRGREQQVIVMNGGAQSSGGRSRNMINGVSPWNPLGFIYDAAATSEFGTPLPKGNCQCD